MITIQMHSRQFRENDGKTLSIIAYYASIFLLGEPYQRLVL